YRVRQKELLVAPRVGIPLSPRLRLTLGPLLKYAHTLSDSGTVLATTGPYYGTGDFGQVGARAALELDTRDFPAAPARGLHVSIAGQWYPAVWDVVSAFASVSAEASTYLSAGDPPSATLALRLGGAAARAPSARRSISAWGSCSRAVAALQAGLPVRLRYPSQPGGLFSKETPRPPERRASPVSAITLGLQQRTRPCLLAQRA